ncbi:MAG: hypothetical protein WC722_05795 [Rhodospirillales bacterium]|jgi:hypothetical protein
MVSIDKDRTRQILTAIGTASYALADLRRLSLEARLAKGASVTGKALRDIAALEQSLTAGFAGQGRAN